MKRILITTLLACISVSPAAFSGIGDRYDCDTEANMAYRDGSLRDLKPEQFNFFWTEKGAVFGEGGMFEDFSIPIREDFSNMPVRRWDQFFASDDYSHLSYDRGRFRYSMVSLLPNASIEPGTGEIRFVIANCSKSNE